MPLPITIDTFHQLLVYLLDPTTHFAKWYIHRAKMIDASAQYKQLISALYFDRALDDIRQDIEDLLIPFYDKLTSSLTPLTRLSQTNFINVPKYRCKQAAVDFLR